MNCSFQLHGGLPIPRSAQGKMEDRLAAEEWLGHFREILDPYNSELKKVWILLRNSFS